MYRKARLWGILTISVLLFIPALVTRAQQTPAPGSVCVLVFADTSKNGTRDGGEAVLPDIDVDLMNNQNVILANRITDGTEPYCFTNLAPRDYTVTFNSPFYQATTPVSYNFALLPGSRMNYEFGVVNLAATPDASTTSGGLRFNASTPLRIGLSAGAAIMAMLFMIGLGMIIRWGLLHRR